MPKCLNALDVRWLEIEVALVIQLFLSNLVGFFFLVIVFFLFLLLMTNSYSVPTREGKPLS